MIPRIKSFLFHLYSIGSQYVPSRRKIVYDVVVIRTDRLGDYILWQDAWSTYQKVLKGLKVLLICSNYNRPLIAAGDFDLYEIDKRKIYSDFRYFRRFLRDMKSICASKVINTLWLREKLSDIIVEAIKADEKIGMSGYASSSSLKFHKKAYTRLIDNPETFYEIRSIEHFTRKVIDPEYKFGYYQMPVEHKNFGIPSKYCVISFSASDESRSWPYQNYAAIINRIPADYKVVLSGGGAKDRVRAEQIKTLVDDKDRMVDMVDKTTVNDFVSLIAQSRFVVGNDSGAVHIAAAAHIHSIAICRKPSTFIPYPEDIPNASFSPRPIFGTNGTMQSVTVEMVSDALQQLLIDLSNE